MPRRTHALVTAILLTLAALGPAAGATGGLPVAIGGRPFTLELAMDPQTRYQGLSGRPALRPGTGMLFVFPAAGQLAFCMRDCPSPIDLLYLDGQGRLLASAAMTPEPRRPGEADGPYNARLTPYPSPPGAQFAVELPGGSLRGLAIGPGDQIITVPRALAAQAR